ncbi:unnamed protein product [Orchesella dallaii]|uniref:C2H2-type domain-containing protein n=1 Tax=Orchesella dallaii TaxID=48710 RepID=A0ABP1PVM8_9HEXA
MSANNSSPSASIPVEHVYMWYSCVSVKKSCSRAFHTIPLLKKHFLECHPDEQFVLPYTPSPGTLEGRIIYHKEYFIPTGELVQGADNTMVRSGFADTPPVTGGSVFSKRECGICHKIFKSRTYRDIHLEKQHGIIIKCFDSTDDELESSEDENDPATEAIPVKEDGEGGQATPVEGITPSRKLLKMELLLNPKLCVQVRMEEDEDVKELRLMGKRQQFLCNICNKSFGASKTLKKHFMLHTGVRPFKCCFCEAAFPVKENLVQHLVNINTHKQERKTANDMANEAGLNYLKLVKERTAQELKNLPHCSIALAVVDYVFKNKDGQQIATSSALPVKNDRKVGKGKTTMKPKGTRVSCQLCRYQCPSEKRLKNHGKLHENDSNTKVCLVCGWLMHRKGITRHMKRYHGNANATAVANIDRQ